VDPIVSKKEVKAAVIMRPVRGQQQHFSTTVGSRMAPWAADRAKEQTVGDVQPGKISGRIGPFGGVMLGVAPVTGGGRSQL
jgi:hypothetical protein